MFLINCPNCGPRDEFEFRCGGQTHITRPEPPEEVSDPQWAAYLFMRPNPKGVALERWVHSAGCGQWFNMARSTVTHEILAVYAMGEAAPALSVEVRL